jgi:hypothetical protein
MAGIQGTNVVAPIVPLDTADVHPTHEALYGKGGYRTVATTVERDAIPAARREAGMLVFVTADSQRYRLGTDLTTWTVDAAGASAWADITGKPSTFAPSTHTHVPADVGSSLGTASLQGDILQLSTIVSTLGTAAERDVPDAESNASTGQVVLGSDTRLTNARTPTSHAHGNVSNSGAIGTTANLPVITTTSGVLTVGSFGTGSNTFCQGNDSRLSDSRSPSGAAGGDLTGSYPNPQIAAGAVTEADLANAVRVQMLHPFLLAGM